MSAMDSSRKVLVFGSDDEMADFMVERWSELSSSAIERRGYFAAALSGGETPVCFYHKLATRGAGFQWNRIHLFLADERFVRQDHTDSNYRLLRETLLKDLPLPDSNIHGVTADWPDAQLSARKYEEEMKGFFILPSEGLPEFDLIMLGLGTDGHTASLFPGDKALNDTVHLACEVHLDRVRHDRITLTLPVINNAGMVVFLVSGKNKASVLRDVVEKRNRELPAALVNPEKGSLLFLTDAEAAQYLSGKVSGHQKL